MHDVGVKHIYKQVDLSTAGSQLDAGSIDAMIIYAAGGKTPPPWIAEASLAVDWAALNPTAKEVAKLKADGFAVVQVPPANFHKKELYVKNVTLLPFYWGFDVGSKLSTDEMYKMLTIIEKHADELGKLDPSFREISGGHMAEPSRSRRWSRPGSSCPSTPDWRSTWCRRASGTRSGIPTSPRCKGSLDRFLN